MANGFSWDTPANAGSSSGGFDFLFSDDKDKGLVPLTEQAQRPLHGMDPLLLERVAERGIDVSSLIADPEKTARLLKREENNQRPELAADDRIGIFGKGARKYLGQRFQQGEIQSRISMLGWGGLTGTHGRDEMLSLIAKESEQLPFDDNWNVFGYLDKVVGQAFEIGGQAKRTFVRGVTGALAFAPFGAIGGPTSPLTVPLAAAVGGTSQVLTASIQENSGSLYHQIVAKDYEMYPDLDHPGQYLSSDDYEFKKRNDERYASSTGYTPELTRIEDSIAKPIAMSFGIVMGFLELAQISTFAKALGGFKVLQKAGDRAARSILESGAIRKYVADTLARSLSVGITETGQEVVQEIVGYTGARFATALAEELDDMHSVAPEDMEKFLAGMAHHAAKTAETMGPAMLFIGAAGGVAGAAVRAPAAISAAKAKKEAQRVRADGTTDFWFDQETGDDVDIKDIFVEEGDLLDRDKVRAASVLDLTMGSNLTLPPLKLSVRTDGSLIAEDSTTAAMTKVLRDAGVLSVRATKVDRTKGLADSKQAAELFSDDPIKAELASQFPNDSVAEIQSKVLFLKLASSRDGLPLNTWLGGYFQDGLMFPKVDTAATTTEAGVEVTPTIDRALFNPPGAITDVTETMDAPTTPRRESSYVSIEPTIPGAPTIHPDFQPTETATPADPTIERQEAVEEPAVGAAQMRVSIGETMSRKTFLAKIQADAEAAGDTFLAQAARNVEMDQVDAIEGDVLTPAEHTSEVMPDLIEESERLESEEIRQRRANRDALMKQDTREQKEAAMASELTPTDAKTPDLADIEDPEVRPYQLGTVSREELRPAFNTSIPAEADPVIFVDMDDNYVIISGIAEFNAAASTTSQQVSGKIFRAVDGVTLEEAQQVAAQEGVLADLPESDPLPRDSEEEVVLIKSDGETVGAVEFDESSKALLRAFDSMDTKSWLHGLAPVFRKMLPAREASVAARWAGAKHTIGTDGRVRWTWDDASNYKFASGFTQYLQEGKVSFPELQPIWDTLSKWTKASYAVNRTRLTKPIRDIYESLLVDERSPSLNAYQANIQMVGQVADMTFRSPTSATLLRLQASDGRSLLPVEEGGVEGDPLVFVEAINPDGMVLRMREYSGESAVDSAVRDISGVPTAENPATMGDASYRPHAAKQGPVSGFYGDVPIGDVLPADAGLEGSIFVGGKPVDSESFIGDVISQLDASPQLRLREGAIAGVVTSWRRYDYATELLASGVKGPLFQVLSRDIDTGRAAEKRTRFDLNDIQRNKLLQRGWTERQLRQLPGRMKDKVEVSGWKHKKAKDTWTIGDLLSFNRHLRAGQNRVTLLERGFRDGPDGDLIRVDEEDIATLIRAYSTIPAELRDLGEGVVDELMDVIHEKMDPVHRKSRRRGLGYVPNYWDLERAPQDRSPEMIKEEMENADALDLWRTGTDPKLGVFEGMTHHRTRKSAPIVLRPLDFQLMRNIDRASMYVGFELPLKAARQVFEHPQARAAMERRMGKNAVRGLEKGLEGVARRWVDESIVDKTFQSLQRKITVATLGGNIPVWIKQTLSYPLYGTYVPAKYLAAAAMRAAIPSQYKEMKKSLSSFDPTFMARSKGFDISLQDSLEKTAAGEAWGKRRVTELFMKGITYFDQRTVTTGSHAAYLQAIDEFRTGLLSEELKRATQLTASEARALTADQAAEKAYEYANWVTVRTQPNFLPEHVSAFQRDKITRFLSMYSGYTNVAYNMLLRTRWRAMQEKTPQARAAMLKAFFWIYVGNAAGVATINYLKQVWLGNAPDEEELPSWLAKEAISSATAPIYLVKDAVFQLLNREWADYSPSPIISAGKEMFEAVDAVFTDLIEEGEVRASTVGKALRAAGFVSGWPLYSMQRYGEATIERGADLYDLFDGVID